MRGRHAARQGQSEDLPARPIAAGQLLRKVLVDTGLAATGSEATRKIAQGGVRVDGGVVTDIASTVGVGDWTIQAGKKLIVRVAAR